VLAQVLARLEMPCGGLEVALLTGEVGSGDPGELLPIYTRLSDAEENEAARAANASDAPPASGVAGDGR
jgi:hypothetical protein